MLIQGIKYNTMVLISQSSPVPIFDLDGIEEKRENGQKEEEEKTYHKPASLTGEL